MVISCEQFKRLLKTSLCGRWDRGALWSIWWNWHPLLIFLPTYLLTYLHCWKVTHTFSFVAVVENALDQMSAMSHWKQCIWYTAFSVTLLTFGLVRFQHFNQFSSIYTTKVPLPGDMGVNTGFCSLATLSLTANSCSLREMSRCDG